MQRFQVTSDASPLREYLTEALSSSIKMLLGIEQELPCLGGRRLRSTHPTELIISSFLNQRFSSDVDRCYGFSERLIASEIKRLYNPQVEEQGEGDDGHNNYIEDGNPEHSLENDEGSILLRADAWAVTSTPTRTATSEVRRTSIRDELTKYRTEISGRQFSSAESRTYLNKK